MKKAERSRKEIRLSFMAELFRHLDENDIIQITKAFNYANDVHKEEVRDDGSRYIEHCVSVALILLIECKITILDFILVALLHDVPETKNLEGVLFEEESFSYIAKKFGVANSLRIRTISKLKVSFIQNHYFDILHYYADMLTIFVKLADTLHNIRTLKKTNKGKQMRKVLFTKDELPLLMQTLLGKINYEISNKRDRKKFFFAANKLNDEIKKAIEPYNHLLDYQ